MWLPLTETKISQQLFSATKLWLLKSEVQFLNLSPYGNDSLPFLVTYYVQSSERLYEVYLI